MIHSANKNHLNDAVAKMDDVYWKEAKNNNTIKGYKKFINIRY